MIPGLTRSELQRLAQEKLDDAILLFANMRFSNSYYLAGYAIELGLKACIARQISAETIPNKDVINSVYQHDFKNLIGIAGLTQQLADAQKRDPDFGANWATVYEWKEIRRYQQTEEITAKKMIEAVSDSKTGVLTWIKTQW